ncbi:MAG: MAPEG family protein [Gammaproteobacteria bacterium]|jgi:uncharacterized MAPEG superfamily protein|nr:MAPEG family protein [Gammaproteobacteria bacterium]
MNELAIELNILLWSTILYLLHILVAAVGADANNGIAWAVGNHDTQPELPGWVNRARRAQANMAENLLPFACLVLIAHVSGNVGFWSALGAQIFLVSRIAFWLLYLAGVKIIRTIVYLIGVVGMGMVAFQIF